MEHGEDRKLREGHDRMVHASGAINLATHSASAAMFVTLPAARLEVTTCDAIFFNMVKARKLFTFARVHYVYRSRAALSRPPRGAAHV